MKIIQKYVLENWKLKALSLVLGFMLWLAVFFIGEMKKEMSVQVSVINLSKEYVVVKMDPEKVDVTLSGRVSLVKDIKHSDIKVTLSLLNAKEGESVFSLTKNNVQIPKGVQIEQIKPTAIKVQLDRIVEKKVKTVVRLERKLAGRYGLKSWAPGFVTIEGPRRVLETKDTIETNPVGGNLNHDEEVVMVSLNPEGFGASRIKPNAVKVVLRREGGKKTIWD